MSKPEPSLNDIKRQATTDHILTAARRYALDNGIDVSMEKLAEAAGVSRRTLFRLFGTREDLLAAALKAGMKNYQQEIPPYEGDYKDWLQATCSAAHRMNSTAKLGFWELAFRQDLPDSMTSTEQSRRRNFRRISREVAAQLWQAKGADDKPPVELVQVVSAHLSPFFTAAVITDMGGDWSTASELAFEAIEVTLNRLTQPG